MIVKESTTTISKDATTISKGRCDRKGEHYDHIEGSTTVSKGCSATKERYSETKTLRVCAANRPAVSSSFSSLTTLSGFEGSVGAYWSWPSDRLEIIDDDW